MKPNRMLFAWGLFVMLIASCSGDRVLPTEEGRVYTPQVINHYQRSESEAKREALDFLTRFKAETRSALPAFAKTHYILTASNSVRNIGLLTSTQADTSLFILDLADGGSLLVTGDRRNEPVLAYTEHNSLSELFADVDRDSNELYILIDEYLQETVFRSLPDEQENASVRANEENQWSEWEKVLDVRPMVAVAWHQGEPYNYAAPIKKKKRTLAGCSAIAVAQVMTYHRFPEKIDALILDWDDILTPQYSDYPYASQMIRKLGDHLRNDWGHTNTGAKPEHLPKLLRYMGYEASDFEDYNYDRIVQNLQDSLPMIFGAYKSTTKFLGFTMDYSKGHAWVVDGGIVYERFRYKRIPPERNRVVREVDRCVYHHCNWGWGGKNNGYYYNGVFDPERPVEDPYTAPGSATRGTNYNKKLRITYNIRPKR